MENQTKDVNFKKIWLSATLKALKILLAIVVLFFFCIMSVFFISPNSCASLFNYMGLKRAEESCYEYDYNKNNNITSLYNLVIFEMGEGNTNKELYYLNILLSHKDYDAFCKSLDILNIDNNKNKSLIAFNCNTNSFVINQKVNCMFNAGISHNQIMNFINDNLSDLDKPEYSISTYVELILTSKLIESDKLARLNKINNSSFEMLDSKIETLNNKITNETQEAEKIILYYSIYKNYYAKFLVYKALGDDKSEEKAEAETLYKNAYKNYINLVNKKS